MGIHLGRPGPQSRIDVASVELLSPRLPAGLEGFRIALLADLHFGSLVPLAYVEHVLAVAAAQRPDLTVFAGDLVENALAARDGFCQALADFCRDWPACGVLGNHDYYGGNARLRHRLEQCGVRLLVNRSHLFGAAGGGLAVVGLDDINCGRPDVDAAFAGVPDGAFTVVAGHCPDLADRLDGRRVDLMLAGHTHGGQVCLLGKALVTFTRNRNYVRGLIRKPGFPLYVSRGLGVTGLPIRIGSDPELPIITLRRGRQA